MCRNDNIWTELAEYIVGPINWVWEPGKLCEEELKITRMDLKEE